jgi:hypothetical protein
LGQFVLSEKQFVWGNQFVCWVNLSLFGGQFVLGEIQFVLGRIVFWNKESQSNLKINFKPLFLMNLTK